MFPALPSAAAAPSLRDAADDDFWRGADAVWQRSSQGIAQRSAACLKARLVRRSNRSATTNNNSTKA